MFCGGCLWSRFYTCGWTVLGVEVLTQCQRTCRVSKHSRIFCSAPSDSASRRECTLSYRWVMLNRRNKKNQFEFYFLFNFKETTHIYGYMMCIGEHHTKFLLVDILKKKKTGTALEENNFFGFFGTQRYNVWHDFIFPFELLCTLAWIPKKIFCANSPCEYRFFTTIFFYISLLRSDALISKKQNHGLTINSKWQNSMPWK